MFCNTDGVTSGPGSFKGPIGSALCNQDLDNWPFVDFNKINCPLPEMPIEIMNDLSKDQRQLLAYTRLICKGENSPVLQWRLGPLCHSRWLTLAVRTLALYCKTLEPSEKLLTIVKFILFVYAPTWFDIKYHEHWQNGPKNLFNMMVRTRDMPADIRVIVEPVIQRNAFFALPDNLLAGMLADNDKAVREKAVSIISEIRRNHIVDEIGELECNRLLPTLCWQAQDYTTMINFTDLEPDQILEPAITKQLSITELDQISLNPFIKHDFKAHTQATERGVKLTSAAVLHSYSNESQQGSILLGASSRKLRKNTFLKNSYDVSKLNKKSKDHFILGTYLSIFNTNSFYIQFTLS